MNKLPDSLCKKMKLHADKHARAVSANEMEYKRSSFDYSAGFNCCGFEVLERAEKLAETLKVLMPHLHSLTSMMYSQDYHEMGPPQYLVEAKKALSDWQAFTGGAK